MSKDIDTLLDLLAVVKDGARAQKQLEEMKALDASAGAKKAAAENEHREAVRLRNQAQSVRDETEKREKALDQRAKDLTTKETALAARSAKLDKDEGGVRQREREVEQKLQRAQTAENAANEKLQEAKKLAAEGADLRAQYKARLAKLKELAA